MEIKVRVSNDEQLVQLRMLFFGVFSEKYPLAHPVSSFFSSLSISQYSNFFEDCLKSGKSFTYSYYTGFIRGPYPEDDDLSSLNDEEVNLAGDPDRDATISLYDFLDISLSLSRKVIEATEHRLLLERGIVDEFWIKNILSSIPKIEAQLSALNKNSH